MTPNSGHPAWREAWKRGSLGSPSEDAEHPTSEGLGRELTARHLGPNCGGHPPIEKEFHSSSWSLECFSQLFLASAASPHRPRPSPWHSEQCGTRPSHRPQSAHRCSQRGRGKGEGETRPDQTTWQLARCRSDIRQRGAAKSACEGRRSLSDSCRALQYLGDESDGAAAGWSPGRDQDIRRERGWRGWRGWVSLIAVRST